MLVRLNPNTVGWTDDHPRPRRPQYSGLWKYLMPRPTQLVLFLYETPEAVIAGDTMFTEAYFTADDIIAGGSEWVGEDTSWQAVALTNAGYALDPVL